MDSTTTVTSFLSTYQDLINIVLGVLSGIFISVVTFLLTYRNNWRNKLTKELTVKLTYNSARMQDEDYTEFNILYNINNTNGHELTINSTFLKLPDNMRGNIGPNSTLGEMIHGTSRYYIFHESKLMTHNLSGEESIKQSEFLSKISDGEIKKLRLYVETSRFGTVKSNSIKINKSR